MAKPAPRAVTVQSIEQLTTNMKRLIFTGESLSDFPENQASAYVKMVFEVPGSPKPIMRSMTVVDSSQKRKELTIDIVVHNKHQPEKQGPAGRWLAKAKAGDPALIAGPGDTKLVDLDADWFFIAGDMTALPAIRANLQLMPESAKGYIVLEVPDKDDQRALEISEQQIPDGIDIHWVINSESGCNPEQIKDTLTQLEWLPGTPYIWAAGELKAVLELRNHLNQTMPKPRPARYISSYWQKGLNDEQHKLEKKRQLTEI
ncbi:NADPH-dependent ferric siderophore reductase [Endozoicomonas sp. OPT23]|uniref:siderophore-interacting protein n=1 Tax=Endozoicomonas sp. OPT23 TaxID=2072845 RepID=UPI00129BF686|nr:siderophore-interacting protein [Endozoicomonas sp. OPT23]MRI34516.1 NADPH-dependent ferric siderophore reductase [Endozoicomonas sp. OPT23]